MHDRIAELREDGVTVVLTTHDMDEAAKLSDRVGIIDHGKLLALDAPAALTRGPPGSTTVSVTVILDGTGRDRVSAALSGVDSVERVEQIASAPTGMPAGTPPSMLAAMASGKPPVGFTPPTPAESSAMDKHGQFRVYTENEPAVVLPAVLKVLSDIDCAVTDLSIGTPSLEDVFIHLTGGSFDERDRGRTRRPQPARDLGPHLRPRAVARRVRDRPRAAAVPGPGRAPAVLHAVHLRQGAVEKMVFARCAASSRR